MCKPIITVKPVSCIYTVSGISEHKVFVDETNVYIDGDWPQNINLEGMRKAIAKTISEFLESKGKGCSVGVGTVVNTESCPCTTGRGKANGVMEEYCSTLSELAREASKSPFGGASHRPREMKGYLVLPNGQRHYLGRIEVMIDGYGDGLITDCNLTIKASYMLEGGKA